MQSDQLPPFTPLALRPEDAAIARYLADYHAKTAGLLNVPAALLNGRADARLKLLTFNAPGGKHATDPTP